jgi:DNA-binding MarR family transcriptional regulator
MPETVPLDPYIADVLMRDLTGHDRSPSAFLVYLWLWRKSRGEGRERIGASLQTIADQTGLSKSAVQSAVRHLARRQLIETKRDAPTSAPVYRVLEPWRRQSSSSTQTGA